MSFTPSRPRPLSHWKKLTQLALSSFMPLGSTQDLPVTVLIYCNCYQNGHIFILSAPVSAQINTIHVDIWIVPALQRAVAPIFNMNICLFV